MKQWGLILNVVLFQLTWASAALLDEVYALICLCLLLSTLIFSALPRDSIIKRMLLAVLLGVLMDAVMSYLGVYVFSENILIPVLNIPLWLLIMWVGFACSLCVSLNWAINKPVIFILLCAAFGPASYFLGVKLNIIVIAEAALLYVAIVWGIWAGCFLFLDKHLRQREKDKEPHHEH